MHLVKTTPYRVVFFLKKKFKSISGNSTILLVQKIERDSF